MKDQTYSVKIEPNKKIDRESLEMLRSLGYISSPYVQKKESYGPEDDIKVLLPYYNKAEKAMDLHRAGNARAGIELLKEVITERGDVDVAYSNLATLYKEQGKLREALEVLKLGIERLPSSYELLSYYSTYLIFAGRYDEVIDALTTKNLLQMENDPQIWNHLGFAYWNRGDFENALKTYEKALLIDNEYAIAYSSRAHVYFSIFQKTKDPEAYQKSIRDYSRAIELDPNYAQAYNGLGDNYREVGDLEKAIYFWEKTLKLRPNLEHTLFNLALAHLDNGEKTRALGYFNQYKQIYYRLITVEERQQLDALMQRCIQ